MDMTSLPLICIVGDKEIRMTAKLGLATFLSLSSLAKEYNRTVGSAGTQYRSRLQSLSKQDGLWKTHEMIW